MKEIRRKTVIIIGIYILFLLACSAGIQVKGSQNPWELSWQGEGDMPYFRSSVMLEIRLKKGNSPEQIRIFVNNQQQEISWSYGKKAEIYFPKEGSYDFCIEHENGEREERKIYIELSSPTVPKVNTDSYKVGTWTAKSVKLKVYGAKAISGIERYEYKIGENSWQSMKKDELLINQNMEEVIFVRAISKAGRTGDVESVLVKVWKNAPDHAEIVYPKPKNNGWYQEIPRISYRAAKQTGPKVTEYFRLVNIRTKESYVMKNEIPSIKRDGIYRLSEWSVDEAGNHSQKIQVHYFKIDSQKPKIKVIYKNQFLKKRVCRQQKIEIQIIDENLKKNQVEIQTSGAAKFQWMEEQKIYKIIVNFQKEGMQSLKISAGDYAGNIVQWRENRFEIDRTSPQIQIQGIRNYESYKKGIVLAIQIKDKNRDVSEEKMFLNGKPWRLSEIKEDGQYCLKVCVRDQAGNQTTKKKYFTLNQQGIHLKFLQKKLIGKAIREKDFIPAFYVDSADPVQVQRFLVNGRNTEYVWKKNVLKTKYPITQDGKYILQVFLMDASGNKARSGKICFTYDAKAPEILIEGLKPDHTCLYGNKVQVRTKKKEDILDSVILDGRILAKKKNQKTIECRELGEHVLILRAIDSAGNVSKKRIEFTVIKVLPKAVKHVLEKEELKPEHGAFIYSTVIFAISMIILLLRKKKRK